MFNLFRRSISEYFPQPNEVPIGGRRFAVDPIINFKRDAIYMSPQMNFLSSQDFMDEIDRRHITVNGEQVSVVTKADFDIIGAALGDNKRAALIRARREGRVNDTAELPEAKQVSE